jgi:hypothetical protein
MKSERGMKGKVLIIISVKETPGFIRETMHQFKQVRNRKAGGKRVNTVSLRNPYVSVG